MVISKEKQHAKTGNRDKRLGHVELCYDIVMQK